MFDGHDSESKHHEQLRRDVRGNGASSHVSSEDDNILGRQSASQQSDKTNEKKEGDDKSFQQYPVFAVLNLSELSLVSVGIILVGSVQ